MTSTSIREATLEDLPVLLQLEQEIIDSERPYDPFLKESDVSYYDIPALISDENSHMIVMQSDGEIVGCSYAQIRQSRSCHTHENHCYLGFIYLNAENRGKALGRQLIESLKEWGISKKMRHFHLNVYSANDAAIRAYEKAGFNKVSVMMELVD
ncbi:GNAT family N-acetyltransferase [bacterium]|nr:GNAT family N-acetyltransferase [bacterium]